MDDGSATPAGVTGRGNARGTIFLVDPDRELFVQVLGDTVERFGWICYAYAANG